MNLTFFVSCAHHWPPSCWSVLKSDIFFSSGSGHRARPAAAPLGAGVTAAAVGTAEPRTASALKHPDGSTAATFVLFYPLFSSKLLEKELVVELLNVIMTWQLSLRKVQTETKDTLACCIFVVLASYKLKVMMTKHFFLFEKVWGFFLRNALFRKNYL